MINNNNQFELVVELSIFIDLNDLNICALAQCQHSGD